MTHNSHIGKLSVDPEIDRTFYVLRRRGKQITMEETSSSRSTESPPGFNAVVELNLKGKSNKEEIMAKNNNNKSLKELAAPDLNYQPLCIEYPNLDASFELRSGLIHLLPTFRGLVGEDLHKHLKEFHVICSSMKLQGISKDQIKLWAFPFSLADLAKDWFYYLPSGSINS